MKKSIKICFVGFGSISKRHIKNVCKVLKEKGIDFLIDLIRHNENYEEEELIKDNYNINKIYYNNEILIEKHYDIMFITNPTSMHYETLLKYINIADYFFVEKPFILYNQIDIFNNKLNGTNLKNIYVACPLRYKLLMNYLKGKVKEMEPISIRCICSSYLPEWRKEIDYRKVYSANVNLGGGVRLDLIHEWDYLKFLFGKPQEIKYYYGKISSLDIDSEDYAIYISQYKNMILELHVDYFGRQYQRKIEIYTNNDVLNVDLYKNEILFAENNEILKFDENINEAYIRELEHFFDIIDGKIINDNDVYDAIDTINLTRGIVL